MELVTNLAKIIDGDSIIIDPPYEGEAPISALQGVSENDGKLIDEAFGIKTVKDLADCKYFKWARLIKKSAELEKRQQKSTTLV